MFQKPKRQIRRNRLSSDEEDNVDNSRFVSTSRKTSIPKVPSQPRAVLSFDDELDADEVVVDDTAADNSVDGEKVFRVKKSAQSRRLARQMKEQKEAHRREKEQSSNLVESCDSVINNGDKMVLHVPYGRRTPSPQSNNRPSYSKSELDRLRQDLCVLNGDDAIAAERDGSSDEELNPLSAAALRKGLIPDAKAIHLAKKQRELAQRRGGGQQEEDFISLHHKSSGGGSGNFKENEFDGVNSYQTHRNSRLVREEDHDFSEADDEDGICAGGSIESGGALMSRGGAPGDVEKVRALRQQLLAEREADSQDGEIDDWESQQIRKAMNLRAAPTSAGISLLPAEEIFIDRYSSSAAPVVESHTNPAQVALPAGLPQLDCKEELDVMIRQLRDSADSLRQVSSSHRQQRDRVLAELHEARDSILEARVIAPELELQYSFHAEMRGYVRDYTDCFNEKMAKLSHLERKAVDLWQTRYDRHSKRRRQDVKDQVNEIRDQLARWGTRVVPPADDKERNLAKQRAAEREARRMRRRRVRETQSLPIVHHEGLSTDDEESQAEVNKRNAEWEAILVDQRSLLEDVVEDFAQLDAVIRRFREWRQCQPSTYSEAYVGLCLPRVLLPLLRLDLLSWNPLGAENAPIERSAWFVALLNFCLHEDTDDLDKEHAAAGAGRDRMKQRVINDDDKIIPGVVERVVLPRLVEWIRRAYDPVSSAQTTRLVNLLRGFCSEYPYICSESSVLLQCMEAVVERLRVALDEDVFIPLFPKVTLESRHSEAAAFLQRQFWSAVKLLGNLFSWCDLLSQDLLQALACDALLNRYIMIALSHFQADEETVSACKAIVNIVPRDWLNSVRNRSEDAGGCEPPSCLNLLVRYLTNLGDNFAAPVNGDLSQCRQVQRLLEQLGASVEARNMARSAANMVSASEMRFSTVANN